MKNINIFLILVLLLPLYIHSQTESDSNSTIKFSERISAELILEVSVKNTGAIGYANLFRGKVLNVIKGTLTDTTILVSVLPGDTSAFNKLNNENAILKLFFVFNKSGEKYSTTYITGFVDSEKNSWKLTAIEKK